MGWGLALGLATGLACSDLGAALLVPGPVVSASPLRFLSGCGSRGERPMPGPCPGDQPASGAQYVGLGRLGGEEAAACAMWPVAQGCSHQALA